jgi:hypothetical protein
LNWRSTWKLAEKDFPLALKVTVFVLNEAEGTFLMSASETEHFTASGLMDFNPSAIASAQELKKPAKGFNDASTRLVRTRMTSDVTLIALSQFEDCIRLPSL